MNLWHVGDEPEAELGIIFIYIYAQYFMSAQIMHFPLIHSISKHLQFSQLISVSFAWPDQAESNVRQ